MGPCMAPSHEPESDHRSATSTHTPPFELQWLTTNIAVARLRSPRFFFMLALQSLGPGGVTGNPEPDPRPTGGGWSRPQGGSSSSA